MSLVIFDLDNTLIGDDSDHLWGQFLVDQGLVDRQTYEDANTGFYQDYCRGQLDIDAYLKFALAFLAEHDRTTLHNWRQQFIDEVIRPLVLPAAIDLVESHRNKGDTLLVITATNRFVTEPIVNLFGIENMLATEPEIVEGQYTGDYLHPPCYQHGKVENLTHWLTQHGQSMHPSTFYSDSHNDIPLLELVDQAVAVDPDDKLRQVATDRQWRIISLREPVASA